jgi:hypothetical protein
MSGFFPNAVRSFTSLFGFVLDLMGDGLRFFRLSIRSHSALSAEVLFLRKQLACYEEIQSSWKPLRCQPIRVSGLTITNAFFQSNS